MHHLQAVFGSHSNKRLEWLPCLLSSQARIINTFWNSGFKHSKYHLLLTKMLQVFEIQVAKPEVPNPTFIFLHNSHAFQVLYCIHVNLECSISRNLAPQDQIFVAIIQFHHVTVWHHNRETFLHQLAKHSASYISFMEQAAHWWFWLLNHISSW